MKTRLPIILMAVVTALPWLGQTALAQDSADGSWYLRPRIGVSYYMGDNGTGMSFSSDDQFPLHAGLEVGNNFNSTFSVGLAGAYSAFDDINDFDSNDDTPGDGTRIAVQLIARKRLGTGSVAPFIQFGGGVSFGKTKLYENFVADTNVDTEESKVAFGPLLGIGLDFRLSDAVSFFVETGASYLFGDVTSDGREDDEIPEGEGFGPGDLLGWHALGFKFNLNTFTPVMVTDLICPEGVVDTGDPVTLTGSVNEKASRPVVGSWDFGDGTTATGMTATHGFRPEGTYTVTFTASNGNGRATDSRSCRVTVEDPCETAEIISISPSSMTPDTRTAVRFSGNVRGSAPITYAWDFGDGATSAEANPTHTYAEPGNYTVTLTVTNCGGTVSRTMEISVAMYEAAICREIEEMNPVFFDRNSSTLSEEARGKLQENLEILGECPNLNARVEGWAAPGERNTQGLSADRAKAVEQFYVDNGIALSRLMTVGMGRAEGMTSKKEGLAGYRRVDTIPVRN